MIARVWTAGAEPAGARRYVDYFNFEVRPELSAIEGYRGATVLLRDRPADVEIVVITWWASLDAVRAFAGGTLDSAVVHDRAAALLSGYDRQVRHYQVATDARRQDS
jgi:heme-degrading monooxygenase HmoA